MKKRLYLLLPLVLSGSLTSAASSEAEYQQWLKQTRSDFQTYLDANDKAFIQFLKQKWQAVEVEPGEQRDPSPKPDDLPQAPVNKTPLTNTPQNQPTTPVVTLQPLPSAPVVTVAPGTPLITPGTAVPVQPQPTQPVKPQPSQPIPDNRTSVQPPVQVTPPVAVPDTTARQPGQSQPDTQVQKPATGPQVSFDFYGDKVSIHYSAGLKKTFSGRLNNDNIANYWLKLASSEHKQTVAELKDTAARLGLNDWGVAQLFDAFARTLYRDDNSRILSSWFLLVKAGYDARVAYSDRVHLLITSDQELFGVTYFRLGGKQYYAVNLNDKPLKPGKVFTYEGQHEEGSAPLDFSQPNRFAPGGNDEQRKLAFTYSGKQYQLSVAYPQRYVAYFASYPQLSLPNYFRAGLPAVTAESLLTQLRPVVQGQTELEAVNRLLRFVQTAFAYKTDEDQFREENYLFPLETLHYPYSDCEDRAALFAWLTESLIGLDVVILDYPGHVATAVAFDGNVKGDAWLVNGKRFVIADPTYVNADAGMTMPQFAGVKPKIVLF